jgi:hypothetical protein
MLCNIAVSRHAYKVRQPALSHKLLNRFVLGTLSEHNQAGSNTPIMQMPNHLYRVRGLLALGELPYP